MKKLKIDSFTINKSYSIKDAMRAIDRNGLGIVFVTDSELRLEGVVTDGDIRRTILNGINIGKPIAEIANKNPITVKNSRREQDLSEIKGKKEIQERIPLGGSLKVPVIDEQGRIKDIILVFKDENNDFQITKPQLKVNNEAVKKVLIIGGAGYLGSVLCRQLLNKGYNVRIFDNLTYGDEGIKELLENKKVEFLKGDIRNISELLEAIKGVDAVTHLAAVVGDPACAADPKKTLEINYLATKIIAEICKYFQINRFIFASTCSVYGESPLPDEQLNEESPLNPVSLYAETKIKCEQSILESADENFSPCILRMGTLYGYSPSMRFDLAVNLLAAQAVFDKKITIFGGEQWRPWLSVEDAAQGYIACLESPLEKTKGKIFNILSENYKIIDVAKIINSVCPTAEIEMVKKMVDKRNYNISFNKISKELNYEPKNTINDGIVQIKDAIDRGLIKTYQDPRYRS